MDVPFFNPMSECVHSGVAASAPPGAQILALNDPTRSGPRDVKEKGMTGEPGDGIKYAFKLTRD